MAGIFRLVCGNGLVVAQNMIEDIRVPHKGDITGQVIDGCVSLMEKLPEVNESVRSMASMQLTAGEQRAFATAALVARYEDKAAPVTPDQVLTLRRHEDAAPTIWNTLNTVQESLIRGGLRYVQRDDKGRRVARRQTREIGGIDQNTTVNRALWALAEEMKKPDQLQLIRQQHPGSLASTLETLIMQFPVEINSKPDTMNKHS